MNKYLILLSLIFFVSCSVNTKLKQIESDSEKTIDSIEISTNYSFIKDNLYSDSEGNLYLKSRTRENFETGKWIDVWLKTVYCDTCWTPTENGWTDITELKDFVDVNSFHLKKSDHEQGGDLYEDKNYLYFHKWMADGGTITLMEK
jgi:hypothetical protein